MSIVHRLTGVWLSFGLPVMVVWLVAIAAPNREMYGMFTENFKPMLGKIAIFLALAVLFGALIYYVVQKFGSVIKSRYALIAFKITAIFTALLLGISASYVAIGFAQDHYGEHTEALTTMLAQLMLFGWCWSFFYHFCCGVRHLLWDSGLLLSLRGVYVSGWTAIAISTAFTAFVWLKVMDVI